MYRNRNADDVHISASMQSADQLVSDRTCSHTKRNYASKIKKAVDWFKNNNHSNCLNEDRTEFLLPIPSRPLLEFFGSVYKPALIAKLLSIMERLWRTSFEDMKMNVILIRYQ